MAKTIELTLSRIYVIENGETGNTPAATLLSLSLAYPNPQSTNPSTVKAIKLKDGQTINFAQDVNPGTGSGYTYADRIVFKESIVGRSGLTVSLATVHKTSKLEQLLASIFGAVFGAAWKLLVGGITNVLVGAAVQAVGDAHVKSFEVDGEHSVPIGDGYEPFDENNVPASPLRINLTSTQDVTIDRYEFPPGGGTPQKKTVTILHKGDNNGYVEFEVRSLS